MRNLGEAFVTFFPLSLVLFFILFFGREHIFPWLEHPVHGKELWLNVPFLFLRDSIGLLVLYGLGLAYVVQSLRFRRRQARSSHPRESKEQSTLDRYAARMNITSVLYILVYVLVLTLISYDLIMSMDPHWFSTLFGPYHFVKAFYLGLGALIILAALLRLTLPEGNHFVSSDFHDVGKLFFAFCLLWGDFFYCQLLVIWYGNISEETAFIIKRTMIMPWQALAWSVFVVCFVIPFLVLLNKKVKTRPVFMITLCSAVIIGMWFEHLLLLGPSLNPNVTSLPLTLGNGLIALGFLGLMVMALVYFFNRFPEGILVTKKRAD